MVSHLIPFSRLNAGRLTALTFPGAALLWAHPASFGQPILIASGQTRLEKVPPKTVPQLLEHSEVPKEGCIQEKMIEIPSARALN